MTSKQRVRAVMQHQKPDRVPAAFDCVGSVGQKLMKHYGFTDYQQLRDLYKIDIVSVGPKYIGPKLKAYVNDKGESQAFEGDVPIENIEAVYSVDRTIS